jgi:hypothetical protein
MNTGYFLLNTHVRFAPACKHHRRASSKSVHLTSSPIDEAIEGAMRCHQQHKRSSTQNMTPVNLMCASTRLIRKPAHERGHKVHALAPELLLSSSCCANAHTAQYAPWLLCNVDGRFQQILDVSAQTSR